MEYTLNLDAVVEASKRVGKLQLKAHKLGTPPIALEVTDEVFINRTNELTGEVTTHKYYKVVVTGTEPIIAGWTFVGTIEHEDDGNIIRLSPLAQGLHIDTTNYRTGKQKCDHCQQIRQRKDTYIVVQLTDPEPPQLRAHLIANYNLPFVPDIKQVGSGCLRDFLGYGDPESIVAYLEKIQEFLSDMQNADTASSGGDMHGDRYESIHYFLANTVAMIATYGWVSKSKALETDAISTVERVDYNMRLLADLDKPSTDYRREVPVSPSQEHLLVAANALEWVRTDQAAIPVAERSEYIHNLIVATANDMMNVRARGIVASLISAYQRNLSQQAERKAAVETSRHIGKIGMKVQIPHVTVIRVFHNDTMYGVSHKHIMRDAHGNTLTWSTSSTELEIGTTYTLTGTIKDHVLYKDIKQTMMTRCKAVVE